MQVNEMTSRNEIIPNLARSINGNMAGYKMSNFQHLRKKIKGLSRPKTLKIFSDETIDAKGSWAFHDGGRTEMQFNIGLDNNGVRYGLAFSLEPSQTLPNPSILFPKVYRLNYLIEEKPQLFENLSLWSWHDGCRDDYSDMCIPENVIKNGSFIFLGKESSSSDIDPGEVLQTFDQMLEIYLQIEGGIDDNSEERSERTSNFVFRPVNHQLPQRYSFELNNRKVQIRGRHTQIQEKLIDELQRTYGQTNVSVEQSLGYNEIDVVVKDGDNFIFFEVKVASSLKRVIREALGQLMEYAYYGGTKIAQKLVIVSDYALDERNRDYLAYLVREFNLPVEYKQIVC